MQLGGGNSFRKKLALATCSLLGVASMAMADVQEATVLDNDQSTDDQEVVFEGVDDVSGSVETAKEELFAWKFGAGVLYYTEKDRVTAVEPVLSAKKKFSTDKQLSLKLVVDTLTGASHNGASVSAQPQTFSGPSGSTSYSTAAGETPLDPTFKDTRYALNAQWEQDLSSTWKGSLGGNASVEHDFASLGANGGVSYDFNDKNSTLSLGVSLEFDRINPEGGIPRPLASLGAVVVAGAGEVEAEDDDGEESCASATCLGATDNRLLVEGLIGFTQILSRRALVQVNYSLSSGSGYMNDPYKIVSLVDGTAGATLGNTVRYIYESRPDKRIRNGIYTLGKYQLSGGDIVDLAYRYYWDDWGINSHTVDFHYRWYFSKGKNYFEPHFRYYTQTPADFYRHSLVDTEPTPAFISGDYRLGDMDAITVGLKYGHKLDNGHQYSVRFEYYMQSGKNSPDNGIGAQVGLELFSPVNAFIGQFIYDM